MVDTDESLLLSVAEESARAAAAELRSRFGKQAAGVRTKSTPTDLVSDADLAAETAIRAMLAERRPEDAILGEEGGGSDGEGGDGEKRGEREGAALRWLVDPLDGTVNFLFGVPAFAVSVACEDRSGTVAGVVLDPIREECFAATRSGIPTVNGERIRPNQRAERLELAMVATGFAYDAGLRARQASVLARVLPRVRDIRRFGAAALDLAWCACGRFDAYYERGLHPWDLAAGGLLASRVGLEVRELRPSGNAPSGVLVGPRGLAEELLRLVEE